MKLRERAGYYYGEMDKGCAVGILLAGNEVYNLGLDQEACNLFEGFRTGMGCGSTCGCLTGAMGALSRKYAGRADLKELCAGFVAEFEKAMGCDSLYCAAIAPKYKTPEHRCQAAVEVAADALEAYIARVDAE
jgi:C_GCAxxG_C_C family probable redox protein